MSAAAATTGGNADDSTDNPTQRPMTTPNTRRASPSNPLARARRRSTVPSPCGTSRAGKARGATAGGGCVDVRSDRHQLVEAWAGGWSSGVPAALAERTAPGGCDAGRAGKWGGRGTGGSRVVDRSSIPTAPTAPTILTEVGVSRRLSTCSSTKSLLASFMLTRSAISERCTPVDSLGREYCGRGFRPPPDHPDPAEFGSRVRSRADSPAPRTLPRSASSIASHAARTACGTWCVSSVCASNWCRLSK